MKWVRGNCTTVPCFAKSIPSANFLNPPCHQQTPRKCFLKRGQVYVIKDSDVQDGGAVLKGFPSQWASALEAAALQSYQ